MAPEYNTLEKTTTEETVPLTQEEVERLKKEEITSIAKKQLETSSKFKQPRMSEILDNENINNFKIKPALLGRINIPFDSVFLSGFIETLVSEVNNPPVIEFEDPTGANLKGARKVAAAFERDAKRMRLKMKVRALKKLAAISGRAIAKYYAESDPKYCPYFNIVDYLDFHCEPNGGGHLDDHYFTGEENIFRSKEDIKAGIESGWYDKAQGEKLIAIPEDSFKKNNEEFNNKSSRYAALGLDPQTNNYIGGTLYNLVEWVTSYEGERYHLIFEKSTGTWLRCVPLVDDFGIDKSPYISFAAPMEDAFNFWNLGPADKVKPVFEAIRVNLNEILNNNRKRNWDMKAVNKKMFPDLKKLDWRQDGIVHADVPMGESIQNGIYRFETPEISGAINLNEYLNNIAGEKLGSTPGAQGNASEQKVGIYQGNMLQISKRMKINIESVEAMFEDIGVRYDWGLWDHASEDEMVKLISTDGVGWEKITKEDKDPDYVVVARTSEMEKVEDAEEKKVKLEAMVSTEANPTLFSLVNPRAHIEEKYRLMGFSEEKIKKMLNTKEDATDEMLSEAKKAIEQILEGKDVKLNFSATTGYLQYISDWILENSEDLKPEVKKKLEDYFERHIPIATKNAEQKQFIAEMEAGASSTPNVPADKTVVPDNGAAKMAAPIQA